MNKLDTFYDPTQSFIDDATIFADMEKASNPDPGLVRDILAKAEEKTGLSPFEAAALLQNTDRELDAAIFDSARAIKKAIYGNRIVLFAPLYVSNECGNRCEYCAFSAENNDLQRKTLRMDELRKEIEVLEQIGHKRVLLVYGEHPKLGADWIADTVRTVYDTLSEKSGEIRRANINCAPLDVEGFRKLHEVGIGTYQCFQETYHKETYLKVHHGGKKRDFLWRLYALHRAQEAGIDDVAQGVLFGLYNPVFDLLGLLYHALELERVWGVGPHTISFPRMEPAQNSAMASDPPYPISQHDFKKIVAILRLAVPYTGLILTTRETAEFRKELIEVGVSQISAGSRTYPGAYQDPDYDKPEAQQFCISDSRSLDEVIQSLVQEHGYVPSWCTACYRLGRTGESFMELAKKGFIQSFCLPNGLMTFKEYLMDFASEETRKAGEAFLQKELETLQDSKRKELIRSRLQRIENGERDLYI